MVKLALVDMVVVLVATIVTVVVLVLVLVAVVEEGTSGVESRCYGGD